MWTQALIKVQWKPVDYLSKSGANITHDASWLSDLTGRQMIRVHAASSEAKDFILPPFTQYSAAVPPKTCHVFVYFSSAVNTLRAALLSNELLDLQVDPPLVTWITNDVCDTSRIQQHVLLVLLTLPLLPMIVRYLVPNTNQSLFHY